MDKMFGAWNAAAAAAFNALGTNDLPEKVEAALRTIVDFDILMVFGYCGPERPIGCYHNMVPNRSKTVIDAYASGPYLLDPFYSAAMDLKISGVRRLKTMAPDHFYSSEYYKHHYALTGIRDEVGIVCRPRNWTGVVISFTRPVSAPVFGRRDLSAIREAEPLLRLMAENHWGRDEFGPGAPSGAERRQDPINDTLNRMSFGILTPREIEITSLILRGHSNVSIADSLSISPGTVKIHRKNIHQKLEISNQSELFAMFIRELSTSAAA